MNRIIVVNKSISYGRNALMYIQNGVIEFDTADLEYGKGIITVSEMKEKIKEYEKLSNE
jgi:hypothetical protein